MFRYLVAKKLIIAGLLFLIPSIVYPNPLNVRAQYAHLRIPLLSQEQEREKDFISVMLKEAAGMSGKTKKAIVDRKTGRYEQTFYRLSKKELKKLDKKTIKDHRLDPKGFLKLGGRLYIVSQKWTYKA